MPLIDEVPLIDLGAANEVPLIEEVPLIDLGAANEVPLIDEVPLIEVGATTEVPLMLRASIAPFADGWVPIASTTCPTSTFANFVSDIAGVRSILNSSIFATPMDRSTAAIFPFTNIVVAPGT